MVVIRMEFKISEIEREILDLLDDLHTPEEIAQELAKSRIASDVPIPEILESLKRRGFVCIEISYHTTELGEEALEQQEDWRASAPV